MQIISIKACHLSWLCLAQKNLMLFFSLGPIWWGMFTRWCKYELTTTGSAFLFGELHIQNISYLNSCWALILQFEPSVCKTWAWTPHVWSWLYCSVINYPCMYYGWIHQPAMPLSDHISEPFLALVGVLKLFVCCRIVRNIPTFFYFTLLILLVYVVKLKISKIESQKVGDITKLWKLESWQHTAIIKCPS